MKTGIRFLTFALTLLIFSLPSMLSAQSGANVETLALGDTVEGVPNTVEYLLDAEAGQLVTLRWVGGFVQNEFFWNVDTEVANADGLVLPEIGLLETDSASYQVYRLEGAGPFHISASLRNASNIALNIVAGDQITYSQQSALAIGGTVSGGLPALEEVIVIPLTVEAGEVFTVKARITYQNHGTTSPIPWTAVVREANGQIVVPDNQDQGPTEYRVYTADGELPYRLEFKGLGQLSLDITSAAFPNQTFVYSVLLEAGNTSIASGEMLVSGERHQGQIPLDIPLIFALNAEENPVFTLRYEAPNTGPVPEVEMGDLHVLRPIYRIGYPLAGNRHGSVEVYSLEGTPPYQVVYRAEIGDSDLNYTLLMENGDTIVRREVGVLAPGERVDGTLPPEDDVIDYYALDVDPTATVTLNWNRTGTQYYIRDSEGNWLEPLNHDEWQVGYKIIDLSTGTPPFVLEIDSLNAGEPYTFTLAEGETPLAPADATLASNASNVDVETSTDDSAPAGADLAAVGSCSVSAISDVNQRSGAGTNFSVAGTLAGGSSADVDGQTTGADGLIWYRLTTGSWVRSDVVTAETACSQVAVVMP